MKPDRTVLMVFLIFLVVFALIPFGLQGPPGAIGLTGAGNMTMNMTLNMTMNMTANMTAGPQGIPGIDNLTANMTAGPQGPSGPSGGSGPAGPNEIDANVTMTNISGLIKGDGAYVFPAVADVDYSTPSTVQSMIASSDAWNLSYYLNDTSRALTGGFIHRDVGDQYLSISGGNASPPYGGNLQLYGGDNGAQLGGLIMAVPNASGDSAKVLFSALGRTETPELDLNNNKIINLKDPTAAQDAVTLNKLGTYVGNNSINDTYAYLPGRAGGQSLTGGLGSNDNLTLASTSNPSVAYSYVLLQPVDGYVGIGETYPISMLHISGGSSSTEGILLQDLKTTLSNKKASIKMSAYNLSKLPIKLIYGSSVSGTDTLFLGGGVVQNNAVNLIRFYTAASQYTVTGTARMSIDGAGNVSIGTTQGLARLQVNGTLRFPNLAGGTLTTDASGNVYVVSDEKVKTQITPWTKGLSAVLGVNPISYKFKPESGLDTVSTYYGFSADNLRGSIPESVFMKPDVLNETSTGTYTAAINDRVIIATLVNAVKEQQAEIKDQQGQIDNLTKRIEALEKKVGI
jgi:hypothetical protein